VEQAFLPGIPEEYVTGIPEAIKDMRLYAKDKRLCKQWNELVEEWRLDAKLASIDILAEVRAAHRWEVANPARRKKDRGRFLNNWLSSAAKQTALRTSPGFRELPKETDFRTERENWFKQCAGPNPSERSSVNTSLNSGLA
jgi:hypothetical protein